MLKKGTETVDSDVSGCRYNQCIDNIYSYPVTSTEHVEGQVRLLAKEMCQLNLNTIDQKCVVLYSAITELPVLFLEGPQQLVTFFRIQSHL